MTKRDPEVPQSRETRSEQGAVLERQESLREENETEQQSVEIENMSPDRGRNPSDFFEQYSARLGYRSNLNLTIRTALVRLERNVGQAAGIEPQQLRKEFLTLGRRKSGLLEGSPIPIEFALADYRLFLILCLAIAQQRRSAGVFGD